MNASSFALNLSTSGISFAINLSRNRAASNASSASFKREPLHLGINESGSIVGQASNSLTGAHDAFSLTVSAVPEPETYAMLLAGLSLMGFMSRRKNS